MALQTTYSTGTATINAGEIIVTGVGTGWMNFDLRPGDLFWAAGLSVRIASVDSNTQLTLAYPWPGTSRNAQSYEARVTPDVTRVLASARAVLDALTNGVLYAFSSLVGAADRLPYFTGAGTAALATFTAVGRSIVGAANQAAARTALGLANIASSGSAADLTGTVPDGVLPARLSMSAGSNSITDANLAMDNGLYSHSSSAANLPVAAAGYINVVRTSSNYFQQYWYERDGNRTYRRRVTAGAFGAWERWYSAETELDVRYAQIAGPATDKGQALGSALRRFASAYVGSTLSLGGVAETVGPNLVLNTVAGVARWCRWRTADVERWIVGADNAAENGSNSGSDFRVRAYTDAGGFNVDALVISRATGVVTFGAAPKLPSYTVATLPAASAYVQGVIYVSNGTASKRLAISDGTNWRFPDGAIVS
ncbi:hypothetical protein ASG19_06735 [Rhizobium sp. Leaf306]|uniref:pyocin knob domain-containing protein n=1 Tax=Rhizobium sp. Leaf306 TaxID=1736330 RepID=UPI0007131506|nr:pyocin knob domain-containing protein [Rhizobium sp. Leaf306]KQQ38710.1 hypothetical protein ASG19_06735 [Rhizobium sp. Leaf306]